MPNTWAFGNISENKSFKCAKREKRCDRENHEELYKNNSEKERQTKIEPENALENSIKLCISLAVIL